MRLSHGATVESLHKLTVAVLLITDCTEMDSRGRPFLSLHVCNEDVETKWGGM